MVVLGIDFGSKRIGLAISDAEGVFAFPLRTLERRSLEQDLAALQQLAAERQVEQIVVGSPLRLSGAAAREAEIAATFAAKLADKTKLPVELVDERLTTAEAQRVLRETKVPGSRRKKSVDAIAASLILRTYLAQSNRPKREI